MCSTIHTMLAPGTPTISSVKRDMNSMFSYLLKKKYNGPNLQDVSADGLKRLVDQYYAEERWLSQLARVRNDGRDVLFLPQPHHRFQPLEEYFGT